jgi:hypothetical protein
MDRFRVKAPSKKWTDKGPDLLRNKMNAIEQAMDLLDDGNFFARTKRLVGWWNASPIGGRRDISRYLERELSSLANKRSIQVLDKKGEVQVEIRLEEVKVSSLNGATRAAEVGWGLISHQFPGIRFGGCFTCKHENNDPNAGWSDHAWGDALDATENKLRRVFNDAVFDWSRRMAMESQMEAEMMLGSAKGKVVSSRKAEGWDIDLGGASSHLWHVHISCHEHDGTPPCA